MGDLVSEKSQEVSRSHSTLGSFFLLFEGRTEFLRQGKLLLMAYKYEETRQTLWSSDVAF